MFLLLLLLLMLLLVFVSSPSQLNENSNQVKNNKSREYWHNYAYKCNNQIENEKSNHRRMEMPQATARNGKRKFYNGFTLVHLVFSHRKYTTLYTKWSMWESLYIWVCVCVYMRSSYLIQIFISHRELVCRVHIHIQFVSTVQRIFYPFITFLSFVRCYLKNFHGLFRNFRSEKL